MSSGSIGLSESTSWGKERTVDQQEIDLTTITKAYLRECREKRGKCEQAIRELQWKEEGARELHERIRQELQRLAPPDQEGAGDPKGGSINEASGAETGGSGEGYRPPDPVSTGPGD